MREIGQYRIIATIASGYQATVYHALDTVTGENVALKVIRQGRLMQQEHKVQLLWNEAEANKKLFGHRHILCARAFLPHMEWPSVKNPGQVTKVAIFVMPLVECGELYDYLSQGAFPLSIAKTLFMQLLDAVAYAHSMGVYHRDLKPENVLVNANYELLIADWGLSAVLWGSDPRGDLRWTPLGTRAYMPPEVAKGGAYQAPAADMWSLGVILFIMMSGCPPFSQAAPGDWWFDRVMEGNWEYFWASHERVSRFDADTKAFIQLLLNPHPHGRPAASQLLRHPYMQAGPILHQSQVAQYMHKVQQRFNKKKLLLHPTPKHFPGLVSVPVWASAGTTGSTAATATTVAAQGSLPATSGSDPRSGSSPYTDASMGGGSSTSTPSMLTSSTGTTWTQDPQQTPAPSGTAAQLGLDSGSPAAPGGQGYSFPAAPSQGFAHYDQWVSYNAAGVHQPQAGGPAQPVGSGTGAGHGAGAAPGGYYGAGGATGGGYTAAGGQPGGGYSQATGPSQGQGQGPSGWWAMQPRQGQQQQGVAPGAGYGGPQAGPGQQQLAQMPGYMPTGPGPIDPHLLPVRQPLQLRPDMRTAGPGVSVPGLGAPQGQALAFPNPWAQPAAGPVGVPIPGQLTAPAPIHAPVSAPTGAMGYIPTPQPLVLRQKYVAEIGEDELVPSGSVVTTEGVLSGNAGRGGPSRGMGGGQHGLHVALPPPMHMPVSPPASDAHPGTLPDITGVEDGPDSPQPTSNEAWLARMAQAAQQAIGAGALADEADEADSRASSGSLDSGATISAMLRRMVLQSSEDSRHGGSGSGPINGVLLVDSPGGMSGRPPAGDPSPVQVEGPARGIPWDGPPYAVPEDVHEVPCWTNVWFAVAGGPRWVEALLDTEHGQHSAIADKIGQAPQQAPYVATAYDLCMAIHDAAKSVAPGCSVTPRVTCVSWPGRHGPDDVSEERYSIKLVLRAVIATTRAIQHAKDMHGKLACFREVKLTFRVYSVPRDMLEPLSEHFRMYSEHDSVWDSDTSGSRCNTDVSDPGAIGQAGAGSAPAPASAESTEPAGGNGIQRMDSTSSGRSIDGGSATMSVGHGLRSPGPGFIVTVARKAGDAYSAAALLQPIVTRIAHLLY